jgi:hypothetical protein
MPLRRDEIPKKVMGSLSSLRVLPRIIPLAAWVGARRRRRRRCRAAIVLFVAEFMAERANGGGGGGGSGSGGRAAVDNDGRDGEVSNDEVSGRGARARREDALV